MKKYTAVGHELCSDHVGFGDLNLLHLVWLERVSPIAAFLRVNPTYLHPNAVLFDSNNHAIASAHEFVAIL